MSYDNARQWLIFLQEVGVLDEAFIMLTKKWRTMVWISECAYMCMCDVCACVCIRVVPFKYEPVRLNNGLIL